MKSYKGIVDKHKEIVNSHVKHISTEYLNNMDPNDHDMTHKWDG